ncbi:MAG TPA: hypothetical protein VF210_22045 [Pseudomonadales bacterium]
MTGLFKDDLTVALDEVDRTASRIVTVCSDLAAITPDPEAARRLTAHGERLRQALVEYNRLRRRAGQVPEVGDPERAHLQSLWLALKQAVSGEDAVEQLDAVLRELDGALQQAVAAARAQGPEPELTRALERLEAAGGAPR